MGCIGSRTLATESVPVGWKGSKDLESNSIQRSSTEQTRTEISWDGINLSMEDTTSILPSLKRQPNQYSIGALAKSSLSVRLGSGLSRSVRDHITKPTAMAQGRVAHLIEWQGWSKQTSVSPGVDTPHLDIDSYSDLSDGEKEARFAAGVMKQFAISEATLMAWSSLDGEQISDVTTPENGEGDREEMGLHYPPESWPHILSQGLYCLSTSDAWEGGVSEGGSLMASPATQSSGGPPPLHSDDLLQTLTGSNHHLTPSSLLDIWESPPTLPPPAGSKAPTSPAVDEALDLPPLSPPPGEEENERPRPRKASDVISSGVQSLEDEEAETSGQFHPQLTSN